MDLVRAYRASPACRPAPPGYLHLVRSERDVVRALSLWLDANRTWSPAHADMVELLFGVAGITVHPPLQWQRYLWLLDAVEGPETEALLLQTFTAVCRFDKQHRVASLIAPLRYHERWLNSASPQVVCAAVTLLMGLEGLDKLPDGVCRTLHSRLLECEGSIRLLAKLAPGREAEIAQLDFTDFANDKPEHSFYIVKILNQAAEGGPECLSSLLQSRAPSVLHKIIRKNASACALNCLLKLCKVAPDAICGVDMERVAKLALGPEAFSVAAFGLLSVAATNPIYADFFRVELDRLVRALEASTAHHRPRAAALLLLVWDAQPEVRPFFPLVMATHAIARFLKHSPHDAAALALRARLQ